MSGLGTDLSNTMQELRRRRVFRVAASYAVIAFVVLQLAEITFPAFGLGDAAIRVLVSASLLGFVIVVAATWLLDLTHPADERARHTGRTLWMQLAVIGLLFIVAGVGAWLAFLQPGEGGARQQPRIEEKSIAVLPFVDLSPTGDQEYFGDGIAEELLNVLTRIDGVRVAARSSSFAYKGQSPNVQEVGRELGVSTVLEGSVRKSRNSDRVRVTAQLIDADTGFHIWSETYDRRLRDIFEIQDEITRNIVDALKVRLLGDDREELASQATESVDAYDLYLEGRHKWHKRTEEAMLEAKRLFERAIEIDPDFVRAYTGLADCYILLVDYGNYVAEEAYPEAEVALAEALKRDDSISEVWASLGLLRMNQAKLEEADKALQQALQLDPNNAMAWLWYGIVQGNLENQDEQLQAYQKAYAAAPMSRPINNNLAHTLMEMGRYAEARPYIRRLLSLEAEPSTMHPTVLADSYRDAGDLDQAVRNYREVLAEDPANEKALAGLAEAMLLLERPEAALEWARRAVAVDPLSQDTHTAMLQALAATQGITAAHDYLADAREQARKPSDPYFPAYLAVTAYMAGDPAAGDQYAREYLEIVGGRIVGASQFGNQWTALNLAAQLMRNDRVADWPQKGRKAAEAIREQLRDSVEDDGHSNIDNLYTLAGAEATLGIDGALDRLRQAVDRGWRQAHLASIDPLLAPLRDKPGFEELMARVSDRVAEEREQLDGLEPAAYEAPPAPQAVDVEPSRLQRLAGHYQPAQSDMVPSRVFVRDGRLYWEGPNASAFPLTPVSESRFVDPVTSERYAFAIDDSGAPTHVWITDAGARKRYKRVQYEAPETIEVPVSVLRRYAGTYELSGAAQTVTFYVDDGTLYVQPEGQPAYELEAISEDEFVTEISTNRVRFVADAATGTVDRLVLKSQGVEIQGERVD